MSFSRIKAIILQELFITRRSLEVIVDTVFFSVMSIIIFGFVTSYLAGSINSEAAHYLFMGMILWEIVRVTQYSMSVCGLWNIWSRNLSNMFVAPLSLSEYLVAQIISGAIKTIVIFLAISLTAWSAFDFNIFSLGLVNLVLFFINLTIFSWSVGIVVLGFIFRYGTRIQALAWSVIVFFQPLTAALVPLQALPPFLQTIAWLLPPTYVFEAARFNLTQSNFIRWDLMIVSFVQNIFYFVFAWYAFKSMYEKSRETGQFARNEG